MKENYDKIIDFIILKEGDKAHKVKGDKGGLTAYGGLTLDTMKKLKLDLNHDGVVNEKDIYLVNKEVIDEVFKKHWWNKINGDSLPSGIDLIMADIAWNSFPGKAKQFALEGYVDTVEELTERRRKFYRYLASRPGQGKFLQGWLNRADDALKEAKVLQKWENPITDETMKKFEVIS